MSQGVRITFTTPVLITVPKLFEPVRYDKKLNKSVVDLEKGKFEAEFVIAKDHPQAKDLKAAAVAAAKERWPEKPVSEILFPVKDGTKEADKRLRKAEKKGKKVDEDKVAYLRDKITVTARTGAKFPPTVTDATKGFAPVTDRRRIFGGCQVLAEILFRTYEQEKEVNGEEVTEYGVTAYLNEVVYVADGPRVGPGGGPSTAEKFKGYAGKVSDENPVDEESSFLDD